MKNIERMTQLLEQEAREQARAIVLGGKHEAQHTLKTGRIQAQEQKNEILAQYQLKIQQVQERAQAEQRAQESNMLLAAKQSMIAQVIQSAKQLWAERSVQDEMELLSRVLKRSIARAHGEIPTVLVPSDRLEAAREAVGRDVPVEADAIQNGFVLSFQSYNINFQSDALFHFWKEELEALAANYLFNGDRDEKAMP